MWYLFNFTVLHYITAPTRGKRGVSTNLLAAKLRLTQFCTSQQTLLLLQVSKKRIVAPTYKVSLAGREIKLLSLYVIILVFTKLVNLITLDG